MDNQQITASDLELGWLAGIIDGEGYIGLQLERETKVNHSRIVPQIHICNCDEAIVLRARDIMRKIGINPYIRASRGYGNVKKDIYRLQTKRYVAIFKILSVITPYLTGSKKERAELVKEFCDIRLNAPTYRKIKGAGRERSGRIKPHTARELEIFGLCKPKQKRGISETIRQEQRLTSEIWGIMKTRQLGVAKI